MTEASATQSTGQPAARSAVDLRPGEGPVVAQGGEKPEPTRDPRLSKEASPNFWRAEVLSRLEKPECLMCHEARGNLRGYYFWFVNELYGTLPTITRLQRARGFCPRHTRHLFVNGGPSVISVVGGYVLRSCADWLRALHGDVTPVRRGEGGDEHARSGSLRAAVGCPACEAEREERDRYAWVFVGCLKEAGTREAFRASYGLCLPHFPTSAHRAGWETLQCLVEEQIRRLEDARATLTVIQAPRTDGTPADLLRRILARLYGPDLDKEIRAFLVNGRRSGGIPAAGIGDQLTVKSGPSASWSPAFEETCRLLGQPGCSLCRVAAKGREEYLAWLEDEIRDCTEIWYRWNQAQYLCTEHAWLFADRCSPEVLATACGSLLDRIGETLRQLLWEMREPVPPSLAGRISALPSRWRESIRPESRSHGRPRLSQRVRRTVKTLWLTPEKALDRARARALRWDVCPVCHHVETLETRAADRLLAVMRDAEGRRAFERSYGVCLRHAPLLLERAGTADLRRDIAAILLARVEVDRWEAEEYLRKQSWSQRHEPKGDEQTAWLRVSTRIAGVVMERPYGF